MTALATAAKTSIALPLAVGLTHETKLWRLHRYMDSIVVTDLRNAGKRGKKVQEWAAIRWIAKVDLDALGAELYRLANVGVDPEAMKMALDEAAEASNGALRIDVREKRGVDVTPAGLPAITVHGEHITLTVSTKDFHIRNEKDMNESTLIPGEGGKKEIPDLYNWVKANEDHVRGLTFAQVRDALRLLGVRTHEYCAMD